MALNPNLNIYETKGTDLMNRMLLLQYKDSENLKKYIGAFVGEMDVLFAEVQRVTLGRYIDNAYGESLDIIGRILQQSRNVTIVEIKTYFGFQGHIASDGFGDKYNPVDSSGDPIGGKFRSEDDPVESSSPLSDATYRNILKARGYLITARGGSHFDLGSVQDKGTIGIEDLYEVINLIVLGEHRTISNLGVQTSPEVVLSYTEDSTGKVVLVLDEQHVDTYILQLLFAVKHWFIPAGIEIELSTAPA